MQTFSAMQLRKSTRAFADKKISDEDLQKIIQAALYAPVGMKKFDELKITVIRNEALLKKIDEQCRRTPDVSPLHDTPVLILISSSTQDEGLKHQNAACLVDHMLIAASDLGLASLYIKGICPLLSKNERLKKELGLNQDFTPLASAAVGYPVEAILPREKPFNDVTVVEYID